MIGGIYMKDKDDIIDDSDILLSKTITDTLDFIDDSPSKKDKPFDEIIENQKTKDIKEIDINHYLLTGSTQSSDGDMPANNHGNKDIWVAKLEVLPTSTQNTSTFIKDLNVIWSSGKLQVTINSVNESWQNISITDLLGRVSYIRKVRLLPGKNNLEVGGSFEQGIKVVTVGDARAKIVIAN